MKGRSIFKSLFASISCFRDAFPRRKKRPTIREIKEAHGIRVIPMESFYTWNDDDVTLCSVNDGRRAPEPIARSTETLDVLGYEVDPEDYAYENGLQYDEFEYEVHVRELEPEPDSRRTSTTSMASEVLPDPEYIAHRMAVDEREHQIYVTLGNRSLFISPIANPTKILCAGPGTTVWATFVAEMYPNAEVRCLDPHPYPKLMPPNCVVERAEIDGYVSEYKWDFILVRDNRSVTHWPRFLDHLWSLATLRGWVEVVDVESLGPICTCEGLIHCINGSMCGPCDSFPPGDDRCFAMTECGYDLVRKVSTWGDGRITNRHELHSVSIAGRTTLNPPPPAPPTPDLSNYEMSPEADLLEIEELMQQEALLQQEDL